MWGDNMDIDDIISKLFGRTGEVGGRRKVVFPTPTRIGRFAGPNNIVEGDQPPGWPFLRDEQPVGGLDLLTLLSQLFKTKAPDPTLQELLKSLRVGPFKF